MSRKCPKCLNVYNENFDFCTSCGSRLIDDMEMGSILNLGNDNAIVGGLHINRSTNVTSNDTHYHSTTVHERTKSDAELKLEAKNQLYSKAEDINAERGRIDSVAMGQLRPLAIQLGIDDETFRAIIKDVRSNRNGGSSGLSTANARYLQQAQQAVQTNDMSVLSTIFTRLEAMAAISQDDNVQYLYYLTLSLLDPTKSIKVYEQQTDENYWRSFWAIISYTRVSKFNDATKVLTSFDPLRFEKSEDDRNLLEAYLNVINNDKDRAQDFLDDILGEPSEQIKPLLRAIETTLYEEEVDSLEVRFYKERVLSKVSGSNAVDRRITPTTKQAKSSNIDTSNKEQSTSINPQAEALYTEACTASGAKRVMLLQKAADAGSVDAMYDLGDCYYDGEGIDQNKIVAIKWYTKAADLNHLKSQACLGVVYMLGEDGFEQNYALAEKYLTMAAERDFPKAQYFLSLLYMRMEEYTKALVWARKVADIENDAYTIIGDSYLYGYGVKKNEREGLKYYEKAALAGIADAQNTTGNLFSDNNFEWHDPHKAFKYYHMAAIQDHMYGMFNLGLCYWNGDGCNVDYEKAHEWISKAADSGCPEAQEWLTNNDLECPAEPHPERIIDANKDRSNQSTEKSSFDVILKDYGQAKLQVIKAVKEVGVLSLGDAKAIVDNTPQAIKEGISKEEAESIKAYLEECGAYVEIVECGNNNTPNLPDVSYEKDIEYAINAFENNDPSKAQKCIDILKQYALGDEPRAQYYLALCYHLGYGVKQNYEVADTWLSKSAKLGYAPSMYQLGEKYEMGHGCNVDMAEAARWYQMAANLNLPEGQFYLGLLYIKGEGVIENKQKGIKLIKKAADQDLSEAIDWLRGEESNTESKSSEKSIEIQKVWIDTDDVEQLFIHCNWEANNMKGDELEFRFNLKALSGKKLKVDARDKQWYYMLEKYKPKDNSTLYKDTCIGISKYDFKMNHDETKLIEFNIEVYRWGTNQCVYTSENMTFTLWLYVNIFSKDKFKVRSQNCLP